MDGISGDGHRAVDEVHEEVDGQSAIIGAVTASSGDHPLQPGDAAALRYRTLVEECEIFSPCAVKSLRQEASDPGVLLAMRTRPSA
jgi:hypothetical protein